MTPALLTLLTFVAGVLAIIGIYSILSDLFFRDRSRINQRVDEEFHKHQLDRIRKSSLFKNLLPQAGEAATEDDETGPRHWFSLVVEQSGLVLTPRRLLAMMAATTLVVFCSGKLIQ